MQRPNRISNDHEKNRHAERGKVRPEPRELQPDLERQCEIEWLVP
jgi:hypothetical protein